MRIVVTGNIGTGKSTVSQALAQQLAGFRLVSIDTLVRELYISHSAFQEYVQTAFGTQDRRDVAQQVFADPAARQALVEMSLRCLGPAVDELFEQENLIIEFPLFFENPYWVSRADFIVALQCSEDVQLKRVMARDGLIEESAARIVAAQMPMAAKAALAHVVIDTDGDLDSTLASVPPLVAQVEVAMLKRRCDQFFQTPAMWPLIQAAYTEAHRSYHTLTHLSELFVALAPFRSEPAWPAIELAIWFHDFVYSTELAQYAANEQESARALVELTRAYCSAQWQKDHESMRILAVQLVLATRDHKLTSFLEADVAAQRAAELFLDADRSVLGASPKRLESYDRGIWAEWVGAGTVDEATFLQRRHDALVGQLTHSPLYHSRAFKPLTLATLVNLDHLISRYWRLLCARGLQT